MKREDDSLFGPVIYSYSRAQAIEDGVLVDVTPWAQKAGVKYPTVVTAGLWAEIERQAGALAMEYADLFKPKRGKPSPPGAAQLVALSLLSDAGAAARKGTDRAHFDWTPGLDFGWIRMCPAYASEHRIKAWVHCGPGDTPEPVLTIMLEGED